MVGGSGSSGTKVALIGLAGVLGAALIAAVASVIVAQMNQKEAPPLVLQSRQGRRPPTLTLVDILVESKRFQQIETVRLYLRIRKVNLWILPSREFRTVNQS